MLTHSFIFGSYLQLCRVTLASFPGLPLYAPRKGREEGLGTRLELLVLSTNAIHIQHKC